MTERQTSKPRNKEHDDTAKHDNYTNDFASQRVMESNGSINARNATQNSRVPPLQETPDSLVFISTTIAPSPPPILCDRSEAPATMSSQDTTRQKYPESVSSYASPASASGLRVQTDGLAHPSDPETSDNNQERRPSMPIPIARTPSIKQVLAGSFGSNSYTGSTPNSALSSPQLNAMPDLTPLPSPIMSNDSPGPWRRRISRVESNEFKIPPLTGDTALVTPSGELIPSAIANQSKRRGYHGLYLNSDDSAFKPFAHIREKQGPGYQTNRSLSEYTPDSLQVSKARQQAVSGSHLATTADISSKPIPFADSHMRREPHLALQRGIAPVPQPPTPPSSRAGGESSDSDSSIANTAKAFTKAYRRSKFVCFDAFTVGDHKRRRWRALKPLGEGTFSKVVLATSQLDNNEDDTIDEDDIFHQQDGTARLAIPEIDPRKLVAIKICEHGPKGGASEERVEMSLKRELEIMKSIHHPSLVDLRAWSVEETRAILVLGYCPGGDLFEVASQRPSILMPSLLRRIFAEIVFAIQYLHERHIVHRDIKLENVLVNLPHQELTKPTDWATYPYSVITVTDLGLARRVTVDEKLTTRCGSDDYAAPEVIMGQSYDGRAVDAWSLGVLLYALLESRLPFDPNPGRAEGHKQRSKTSHRIARVEWRWILWEGNDGDHDGDIAKFEVAGLKGAMEVTENLLKRPRSRWTVERVTQEEWVKDAIQVEGGIKFRDEEKAEEVHTPETLRQCLQDTSNCT